MGNVGTPRSHGGITYNKVHGMEIGSFKAFFGNDCLDLTLGGKLGGLGIQWVVGAHPSRTFIARFGDGLNCLSAAAASAGSASLSHDVLVCLLGVGDMNIDEWVGNSDYLFTSKEKLWVHCICIGIDRHRIDVVAVAFACCFGRRCSILRDHVD